MMPHRVNHLFSGFSQVYAGFRRDRPAAEGDWDLIDYSRSWAFARPH
jgi:hypothetical protein